MMMMTDSCKYVTFPLLYFLDVLNLPFLLQNQLLFSSFLIKGTPTPFQGGVANVEVF